MAQADLFANNSQEACDCQTFDLDGIKLNYYTTFLNGNDSSDLYQELIAKLEWQQPKIRIAGRHIPIPRLQAWLGDKHYNYAYSGTRFTAELWPPSLASLKEKIETRTGIQFNTALCNLYRDGQDSVAWHADDEKELGPEPTIASFSLGESRRFQLRKKADSNTRFNIDLEHNSLLVMGAGLQAEWEHQIPKTKRNIGPRINLTFRRIV